MFDGASYFKAEVTASIEAWSALTKVSAPHHSESEDEGYTTPPIGVESDDSSGDESEDDGPDLEIIEDYDEQL